MRKNILHILLVFVVIICTSTTIIAQNNRYKIQYKGTRNTDCLADTYFILLQEDIITNPQIFGTNPYIILTIDKNAGTSTNYDIDEVITSPREYTRTQKFSDGSNTGCTSVNNPQNFDPSAPYVFSTPMECTSAPIGFNWRGVDWEHRIAYKLEPLATYNSNSVGLELLNCEPLNLQFSPLCASMYSIEYQIGNNTSTWTTLHPYSQLANRININFSDFPGLQVGQNIRLRARYNNTTPFEYSEDILTINTRRCSPGIDSISTTDTSCSYSEDGGFTVTFDRHLDPGETLTSISITKATNDVFDDADDVPTYQAIPSATYFGTQFIWPMEIPEGRYRLIYQSNGTNSLEQYDPIIISSPPPLEYDIEVNSDISCFEENDGSVMITIDPTPSNGSIGTPPYFYTMNGGNLIPFTNTTSTIISGLGTEQLELKVFDNNGCTERIN